MNRGKHGRAKSRLAIPISGWNNIENSCTASRLNRFGEFSLLKFLPEFPDFVLCRAWLLFRLWNNVAQLAVSKWSSVDDMHNYEPCDLLTRSGSTSGLLIQ